MKPYCSGSTPAEDPTRLAGLPENIGSSSGQHPIVQAWDHRVSKTLAETSAAGIDTRHSLLLDAESLAQ